MNNSACTISRSRALKTPIKQPHAGHSGIVTAITGNMDMRKTAIVKIWLASLQLSISPAKVWCPARTTSILRATSCSVRQNISSFRLSVSALVDFLEPTLQALTVTLDRESSQVRAVRIAHVSTRPPRKLIISSQHVDRLAALRYVWCGAQHSLQLDRSNNQQVGALCQLWSSALPIHPWC